MLVQLEKVLKRLINGASSSTAAVFETGAEVAEDVVVVVHVDWD